MDARSALEHGYVCGTSRDELKGILLRWIDHDEMIERNNEAWLQIRIIDNQRFHRKDEERLKNRGF